MRALRALGKTSAFVGVSGMAGMHYSMSRTAGNLLTLLLSVRVYPGTIKRIAIPIFRSAAPVIKVQAHPQTDHTKNLVQQTLLLSQLQLPLGFDLLALFVRFLLLPVQ